MGALARIVALALVALAFAAPAQADGPFSARPRASLYQHPGYVAGRWYAPPNTTSATGQTGVTTSTLCAPILIYGAVTIDSLGLNQTTASAGGNQQLALYGYSAATNTLTLLRAGPSASTATVGVVTAPLSSAVAIPPGLYFGCWQVDNAVAVVLGSSTSSALLMAQVGSTTDVYASIGGSYRNALTFGSTFGTWPATVANPTASSNVRAPAFQFHVSSVP